MPFFSLELCLHPRVVMKQRWIEGFYYESFVYSLSTLERMVLFRPVLDTGLGTWSRDMIRTGHRCLANHGARALQGGGQAEAPPPREGLADRLAGEGNQVVCVAADVAFPW